MAASIIWLPESDIPVSLAIIPAIIAAGAALGSAALSNVGKSYTNAANRRIAEQTNQANYDIARMQTVANQQSAERQRMFERESQEYQNLWNLQQWQKENEYNSPASQVARLRQAGINPMMALVNSGTAGQLQSAGTNAVTPATAAGATMQPYQYQSPDYGMYANVASSALEGYMKGQNIQAQEIANRIGSVNAEYQITKIQGDLNEQASRIQKNMQDTKVGTVEYNRLQKEYERIQQQIDYFEETRGLMRQNLENSNDLQQEEIATHKHQRWIAEEENDRQWMRYKLEERMTASNIHLNSAKAKEAYSAADLALQEVNALRLDIFEHGQSIMYRKRKSKDGLDYYELTAVGERRLERAKQAISKLDRTQAELVGETVAETLQLQLSTMQANEKTAWYGAMNAQAQATMVQQKESSIIGSGLRYLFGGEVGLFGALNAGYGNFQHNSFSDVYTTNRSYNTSWSSIYNSKSGFGKK